MSDDLEKLQGAWTLQSVEIDGAEAPPMGGVEVNGDRFTAIGMGHEYAGQVVLDPAARPKRFDLVFTEGPEAGNRNLGIYDLVADTWKLCLDMTGKSRPRAFQTRPGGNTALEVFTRSAAPAQAVVERPSGEGELVGEWRLVSAWQSGHPIDPRLLKSARRITTATHTTTYFGQQVYLNAAYTTDPTRSPKTIDLVAQDKTQLGIYELQGDTLRICFASSGHPRPTDYETTPGDGRTSAVWQKL
jgi:uncharacterized protein (TIGR03067 family)